MDEMKPSEHLSATTSGHLEGSVDLSAFTPTEERHAIGDDGMVIMFAPFVEQWTQVIATFATRGNIKRNLLTKVILEAVILDEQAGLLVAFITTNGATWNRKMWILMGTGVTMTNTTSSVPHPVDPLRRLHFLSDFLHLVKCLRNGLVGSNYSIPAGQVSRGDQRQSIN